MRPEKEIKQELESLYSIRNVHNFSEFPIGGLVINAKINVLEWVLTSKENKEMQQH